MTTDSHLIEQKRFIEFVTAGNATVTVKSLKTGNRFTYKITCSKKEELLFVNLMTGTDNNSDFTYMCHIRKESNGFPQLYRGKTRIRVDAPGFVAFKHIWKHTLLEEHMDNLEIWHEGRCCRCGRKLTVPESIASGIGPECAGMVNKFRV